MKKLLSLFALFATLLLASPAIMAWDTTISGKIKNVDVATPGGNYGLRIILEGMPQMCTGGPLAGGGWAYLNDTDGNYKTFLAAILLAKAQGSTVTIYSGTTGNTCHIEYIST